MASESKSGSRFIIDLGDVKLPPLVEKNVETEIQSIALRTLAKNNISNQHLGQSDLVSSIRDKFPGQTMGLWLGYPNNPPDISGSSGGEGPAVERSISMELAPKIVRDVMAAFRPEQSTSASEGASSTLKRLQEQSGANAEEKEILERIGKARETRDRPSLSKLMSKISDDAQKHSKVGLSVKLLAEIVRCAAEADELRPVEAGSTRFLTIPEKAVDYAIDGFGVGATAGALVGGGTGAVLGGLAGSVFGPSGASAGAGMGGAAGAGMVGFSWGVWGATVGFVAGAASSKKK